MKKTIGIKLAIVGALILLLSLFIVMAFAVQAKEGEANEENPWKYDINGDKTINVADVSALLNYLSCHCGHNYVVDASVEPTCTANGLTEGAHCSICGQVFAAQETIPALGHTPEKLEAVAATCAESGLTEGSKCAICGEILVAQEVIPATGQHTFVALEAVEPTCTETGLTSGFACSVCGQVMIAQEVIPANGHTIVTESGTAPTCTETGTTDKLYCSVCGYVQQDHETIPATGHTYKTLPAVAATCTETGLTVGMGCENCDAIFVAQNVVPALGHDFVDGVCSRCGIINGSEGLQYTLAGNGTYYSVSGIGTCADQEINIPNVYKSLPVKEIGASAFKNCTSIRSIIVPDSVTTIGSGAFSGCRSLESLTIPFVGNKAGLSSTDIYQYPLGYIFGTTSYSGGKEVGQSYYGSSLTELTTTRFYIPEQLKSITVTHDNLLYGAFYNCSMLTDITLGGGMTSIGDHAFYGCTGLTSVTLPNSTETIDDYAFYFCKSLSSITIPDSVSTIGRWAFLNCESLESIAIPNGITSIDVCTFQRCYSLSSIIIPETVTTISNMAFDNCTNLSTIYFYGTRQQWDAIIVGSSNSALESATIICYYSVN